MGMSLALENVKYTNGRGVLLDGTLMNNMQIGFYNNYDSSTGIYSNHAIISVAGAVRGDIKIGTMPFSVNTGIGTFPYPVVQGMVINKPNLYTTSLPVLLVCLDDGYMLPMVGGFFDQNHCIGNNGVWYNYGSTYEFYVNVPTLFGDTLPPGSLLADSDRIIMFSRTGPVYGY